MRLVLSTYNFTFDIFNSSICNVIHMNLGLRSITELNKKGGFQWE